MKFLPLLFAILFQSQSLIANELIQPRRACIEALALTSQKSIIPGYNRNEVAFFGLRRSGNHAIINWIAETMVGDNGSYLVLNDCLVCRDAFVAWDILYRKNGRVEVREEVSLSDDVKSKIDTRSKPQRIRAKIPVEERLLTRRFLKLVIFF